LDQIEFLVLVIIIYYGYFAGIKVTSSTRFAGTGAVLMESYSFCGGNHQHSALWQHFLSYGMYFEITIWVRDNYVLT